MSRARACLVSLCLAGPLIACESQPDPVALKLQAMSFKSSEWSEPVNLGPPVNSRCQDQTPTFSKDELRLYFTSNRPGGLGVDQPNGCQDTNDLWVATRASLDSPWEAPQNLGASINTSANEGGANLSMDGHLLFLHSDHVSGFGQFDLYVARRADPKDDFGWGARANLGPLVNTAGVEAAPQYLQSAEDGSANLYFYAGADNNLTTDIYSLAVTRDGEPRGAAVLVQELSFPGRPDGFPSVRADGREVFFSSGRPLNGVPVFDLWTSTRQSVHDAWSAPVNLGVPVNSSFAEFQPDLTHDGRTLLFIAGAGRGGEGGLDIWMSSRTVSGKEEP